MNSTVFVKNYVPHQFNMKEILRYAACKEATAEIDALLKECLSEVENAFTYKVCYCEIPIEVIDGEVIFPSFRVKSKALQKNLDGCKRAILFGATVGLEIDRIIAKYSRISPGKAVLMQAIGAERIEALCDAFFEDAQEQYKFTRQRFSPGYGDFSLEHQKEIFNLLDCHRKIGLSLNESLLMSPTKSVTAIIGVSDCKAECVNSCNLCNKKDCAYRRNSQ